MSHKNGKHQTKHHDERHHDKHARGHHNGHHAGPADAQLLVKLYEAQATAGIADCVAYIFSNDFPATFEEFREKFPRGSASTEARTIQKALGYYETVGTLHRHGLINEDLLFDWLAVGSIWDRVANWVGGYRLESGIPAMYENFEHMASRAAAWQPRR